MEEMMFGIEFLPQDSKSDVAVLQAMCEGAKTYLQQQVNFVLLPSNPRKRASVNALLSASILSTSFKPMRFVPTLSGSGYVGEAGKRQILSQLLGVKYANLEALALIGGEGEGLSGVEMLSLAREVLGEDIYLISGSGALKDMQSKERLKQKLQAGVDRIITQPFFDVQEAQSFLEDFMTIRQKGGYKVEVSLGVFGVFSLESVRRINEANLGFYVPQSYIDCMQEGDSELFGAQNAALKAYERLWQDMRSLAKDFNISLYLSTPKHNDLRAYGVNPK